MNSVCSTCQNPVNCDNCQVKPIIFSSPVNNKKNNSNFTEIEGTLQRNLGAKQDKNGKEFYFGKLKLEDDSEQLIFFFDPDYNLSIKLQSLGQGDQIKVSGFVNKTGNFTVEELIDNGAEVF
ncbi:MAG: hypothetical protein MRERV_48c008 [Mycoplasmataceae bacterium RV_VA103A]|nr:MAG: hypothetical protein MRERV_48c008 [Mycoplasmataceae bacterium RV_VA103A]